MGFCGCFRQETADELGPRPALAGRSVVSTALKAQPPTATTQGALTTPSRVRCSETLTLESPKPPTGTTDTTVSGRLTSACPAHVERTASTESTLQKSPGNPAPRGQNEQTAPAESVSTGSAAQTSPENSNYHMSNGAPMPTEPMMEPSLEDRIYCGYRLNFDGAEFLPADEVDALTSRPIIENELEKHANGLTPSLIDYVLNPERPAKRVFLILVLCHKIADLGRLSQEGFCDDNLPIKIESGRVDAVRRIVHTSEPGSHQVWSTFSNWPPKDIHFFCKEQWNFLAPIFTRDRFRYKLESACPLPIMKKISRQKAGFFSSVLEVNIHGSHQRVLPEVNGKQPRLASKEIRPDMDSSYEKEADTLGIVRDLTHAHLIMPIAAYQKGELRAFLFPWAEGGNLKEFWRSETARPSRDPELLTWVFAQIHGMCGAISTLHERNCRHGDLKPENVLLFTDTGYKGILRIADVGLAKFHNASTQQRQRNVPTNTMTGTVRYVPPEFGRDPQYSRRYDVWSLGCVFLEFLIWVLYGRDQLDAFSKVMAEQKFWEKSGGDYHVHSDVKEWINHMSRDLQSDDSAVTSAPKDTLELISSHMLMPGVNDRMESSELHKKFENIYARASDDREPGYLFDPSLWQRISTRSLPSRPQMGSSLQVPGGTQPPLAPLPRHADTGSLHVAVGGVQDLQGTTSMRVPSGAAQEPVRTFSPTWPSLPLTAVKQTEKLNDEWESLSDNDFARALLKHPDWPPLLPTAGYSDFCDKCANYDIWSGGFTITDIVGDLRTRSPVCGLCRILYGAARDLQLSDEDCFSCRRVGSTFRAEPDGPTILSIYVEPDTQGLAPPFAQIGYPQLPKQGSGAQFLLLKEWLRVCDQMHKHKYKTSPRFPTRVLDVGSSDSSTLCLCDGERLGSERYIALSHCWGARVGLRTFKENIDEFRRHIDVHQLPQSYQDAILVTRGLGVRYLWIDSLCIVQDDAADWDREAARMEHVFSAAYCTLAASSAVSSAESFLPDRKPRPFARFKTRQGSTAYVCKSIDNFYEDVEQAVLNRRGWVLQERALSRRTIHFTSTQVYWECGSGVHCESLMKLKNPKAAFLGDSDFPSSALQYFKGGRIVLFQNLYKLYSSLGFTNKSDRSVAIKGLEERLVKTFGGKGGFGVFGQYLERSLLWERPPGGSLSRITYPPDRRIPSWSWMTYEGPISYMDVPFDLVDWTNDYILPFTTGSGNRLHWEVGAKDEPPMLRGVSRELTLDKVELMKRVRFDEAKDYSVKDLRCIVIGRDKRGEQDRDLQQYVLVIEPALPGNASVHVRVGVGRLLSGHISQNVQKDVEVR